MTNHVRTFGQAAIDNGFRILPVAAGDKFPATFTGGTWKPETDWVRWGKRMPTKIELKAWTSWAACSIGIPCGDVVGVDLDILNPEIAPLARTIVLEELGPALERVGRRPKALLLYRTETPFPGWRPRPLPVEILGLGQQFVAAGTHPDGHDYVWVGDSPADTDFEDLTVVTEEQVRKCCDRLLRELPASCHVAKPATGLDAGTPGQHNGSALGAKANPAAIEDALANIPNNDLAWDDWTRVGLAVKAAIGDEGKPLFEAWSATAAKNDPKATAKAWKGFKPNGSLGAGTLFAMAKANGWQPEPDLDFTAEDDDLKDIVIDIPAIIENAKRKAAVKAVAPDEYKPGSTGNSKMDALVAEVVSGATGFIKMIANYHGECAIVPQPVFAIGTGIALTALAASRNFKGPQDAAAAMCQVHIAESGAGKDTGLRVISAVLIDSGMMMFLGASDPKSGPAIVEDLKRHPARLYCIDEFGDWWSKTVVSEHGNHPASKLLKEIAGKTPEVVKPSSNAGEKGEVTIYAPAMSILGCTTPHQLMKHIDVAQMEDGLLGRFLYLSAVNPPKRIVRRRSARPRPPQAVVDYMQRISGITYNAIGGKPPTWTSLHSHDTPPPPMTELVFSDEALAQIEVVEAMEDGERAKPSNGAGDWTRALMVRLAERTIQIATLCAISDSRTTISAADVRWAFAVVKLSIMSVSRHFIESSSMTDFSAEVFMLLKIVRKLQADVDAFNADGSGGGAFMKLSPVVLAAVRGGWVPGTMIRAAMGSKQTDFKERMDELLERGEVQQMRVETGSRGRPSNVYRV